MRLEDLLIKYEDEIMYQCFGTVISDELYLKYTQIYSYEWEECIKEVVETYNIFIKAKQKVKPIMLTTMFLSYWCGILTEEDMEALNIDKLKRTFKKILTEMEVK